MSSIKFLVSADCAEIQIIFFTSNGEKGRALMINEAHAVNQLFQGPIQYDFK